MLTFLKGVIAERNEIVAHELKGHVNHEVREPNLESGEEGMTILEDGVVVAKGFEQVYDLAHELHTLHVRALHAPELLPRGFPPEAVLVGT